LEYVYVPFNDPLWVLFSSGTTGKPKPIVQSQGGILLEHLKALTFHLDLSEDDRFFWFTTTGWMMWNFLVGGLLTGSTIIFYDGNFWFTTTECMMCNYLVVRLLTSSTIILYNCKPAYPDKKSLWKFAEETKMTVFGTSASYITASMKDESLVPKEEFDLSHLKN